MKVALQSHLRVSYVWQGEVMSDVVVAEADPVTLGSTRSATFVTSPDLGLPHGFTLLRPGSRGWVLTLGEGMGGTVRVGGQEMQVSEFLESAAGAQGSFKAAGVEPGDWGVIHLDGTGDHVVFFQFVKADPPLPKAGWRDTDLLLPAIAFAIILHGVLIAYFFTLGYEEPSFTWPGDRELVADYLLSRPPPQLVQPAAESLAGKEDAEEAEPASTVGKAAKAGGKGEKERQRAPDPDKGEPDEALPERVQTGLLSKRSRDSFAKVRDRGGFDEKLGKAMARITGPANDGGRGGHGGGRGTGVGDGEGTGTLTKGTGKGAGGGGKAHADVRTQRKLDTGGTRAAKGRPGGSGVKEVAVQVKTGKPSGSFGGLTHEQIMKVVRSRQRAIQACYTRELQRNKGLGGKIEIMWTIDSAGRVKRPRVRKTTLRNGRVEDCVVRQIQAMKFPSPKGGSSAKVNFPFIFAQR